MIVKSKNCLNPGTGQAGITRILRIFEIFSLELIRLIIKYLFCNMKFGALTGSIINCAMEVHNILGGSFQ